MKKLLRILLAVVMALIGLALAISPSPDPSVEPEALSAISYSDVEEGPIYFVKDLVVADQFATLGDDEVIYMLVMFEDEKGRTVAANMPISPSSELWDDVNDYLEDSNQYIGDYTISCYVKAETDYDVEDKLNGMFDEAVKRMRDDHGIFATQLGLRFQYVCDENGDPYAGVMDGTVKIMVIATLFCFAVYFFISAFSKKAKHKAKPDPAEKERLMNLANEIAAKQNAQAAQQNAQAAQPQQVRQVTPMGTFTTTVQPVQPGAAHSPGAAPFQVQPVTAPNTGDVMAQLNHYKALKDAGYMTEAEFEQKRKELLHI